MSISSEISRISSNVSDALDAIEDKGVTIPSGANSDDLATLIAQISGGGTPAISVVDTTDTAGGTIRTITALDISDTTAIASDVASGKYFYTAAGVKTQGTASGGGGATQHTIHLEFSDSTDTTITAYYDSTFISDAITATTPTTYGQKTVTLAQLDGVTWYEYDPSETWETILNTTTVNYFEDSNIAYPYCWIGSLSSVSITVGSVWRITYEGTEYRCTAVTASVPNVGNTAVIGNPKYSGATDDGTEVPFSFVNAGWGAWTGGINAENVDTTKTVKIERLVS